MRSACVISILVLISAFALAACGGGTTQEQSPAPQPSSNTAGSPQASAPASQPASSSPAAKPSDSLKPGVSTGGTAADKGSGPAFQDLLKAKKSSAFKVTYKVHGSFDGQKMSGEQTWTYKEPKFRVDSTMALDAIKVNSSFLTLEDAVYACNGLSGQTTCLKLPKEMANQSGGADNLAFDLTKEVEKSADKFAITYLGSEQIAGQKAYCYSIKGPAGMPQDLDMSACYGEQGAPLKTTVKGPTFTNEMVATNVSKTVTDDDFKLPGTVMELPFQPGQAPGGIPGR